MRMKSPPNDDTQRDAWEHQANVTRTKLVVTLGELDRRSHELFDVKKILFRHRKQLALVAATIGFATVAATIFLSRRRASRPKRLRGERLEALQRVWEHPQWLAPKKRSFGAEVGRKLAMAAIEAAGVRAIERFVNAPPAAQPAFAQDTKEAHA
jgi:hypothetical protein